MKMRTWSVVATLGLLAGACAPTFAEGEVVRLREILLYSDQFRMCTIDSGYARVENITTTEAEARHRENMDTVRLSEVDAEGTLTGECEGIWTIGRVGAALR